MNYSDIDFTPKPRNDINPAVKDKFYTKKDLSQETPGYWLSPMAKSDVIDYESTLLTPAINSRDKAQLKLNDTFDPSNFNLAYTDNSRKNAPEKTGFYYFNKDVGAGRGFGNLNVSNDIRYGDQSRNDTKEYREKQEGQQLFDYQFQYLDKNYQDPNHIVMPIPRGGETTRKQNQLSVNTMRTFINDKKTHSIAGTDAMTKTIKFNY